MAFVIPVKCLSENDEFQLFENKTTQLSCWCGQVLLIWSVFSCYECGAAGYGTARTDTSVMTTVPLEPETSFLGFGIQRTVHRDIFL